LDLYKAVVEVPVTKCGTAWTSPKTGKEYLLVADQMLWFRVHLHKSLMNLNQLYTFVVDVNDNPFDLSQNLGIQCDEAFISSVMRDIIVHFEMHVPTDCELKHLPIILITGDEWNPTESAICRCGSPGS
jgi:hypothetical protein